MVTFKHGTAKYDSTTGYYLQAEWYVDGYTAGDSATRHVNAIVTAQ